MYHIIGLILALQLTTPYLGHSENKDTLITFQCPKHPTLLPLNQDTSLYKNDDIFSCPHVPRVSGLYSETAKAMNTINIHTSQHPRGEQNAKSAHRFRRFPLAIRRRCFPGGRHSTARSCCTFPPPPSPLRTAPPPLSHT